MKLCPTLGSCPHSISKRTDSHKEGDEVTSSSAPGGLCCTWDRHREAESSTSLQHGTCFSCALTCVSKENYMSPALPKTKASFSGLRFTSVDYAGLQSKIVI